LFERGKKERGGANPLLNSLNRNQALLWSGEYGHGHSFPLWKRGIERDFCSHIAPLKLPEQKSSFIVEWGIWTRALLPPLEKGD
jgi:hypothetical protein